MNNNEYTVTEPRGYYANKLLSNLYMSNQEGYQPPVDIKLIQKAIDQLKTYYNTLQEGTHQQAYTKPTKLALLLTHYYVTTEALVATLLYDMVREQHMGQAQVEKEFGRSIANKLAKLVNLQVHTTTIADIQQIDQLVKNGEGDILVIKLLDNLHAMEQIGLQSTYEQLEAALQTVQTFLPLASYMGLEEIENKLVDMCKLIIIPALRKNTAAAFNPIIEIAGFKFQI